MKGNKRLVIAIAVVASALWLALVAYVLIDDRHPGYYVKPGEVVVHAPSPAASSVPAIRTGASHTSSMLFSHHGGVTAVNPSANSFVSFSPETSSGGSMRMFETSSASVHNIGGGGSGGGSGMSGTGGSSNGQGRGIYSSALASGGAIHVAIPSLLISEPGATNAPAMASIVGYLWNRLSEALRVLSSLVRWDSMVAISTWNGSQGHSGLRPSELRPGYAPPV